MSTNNALLAALVSAATPYLDPTRARELAGNIAMTVLYSDKAVEQVIDDALDARCVPRAADGWQMSVAEWEGGLRDALVDAALEFVSEGDDEDTDEYWRDQIVAQQELEALEGPQLDDVEPCDGYQEAF